MSLRPLTIDVSTRLKIWESNRGEASFHLSLPLSSQLKKKEPQTGLAGLDWSLRLLKADGATRLEEKSGKTTGVKHLFISLSHFPSLSTERLSHKQVLLALMNFSLARIFWIKQRKEKKKKGGKTRPLKV